MERIFKHWKTSATAALIAVITSLLWVKTITPEQWMLCMGGVTTAVGLLSKDWDKENGK